MTTGNNENSGKKKSVLTTLITTAIMIAIVGGAVWAWRYYENRNKPPEIDYAKYPVRGIDVSWHNGEVDFNKVASDGLKFVYLKASEGETVSDPMFVRNYCEANLAGLSVGAYHFFRFDVDGEVQANHFLDVVGRCQFKLPLAIDVEDWNNATGVNQQLRHQRLSAMVMRLEECGYKPILYTNGLGYRKYVAQHHPERQLWISSFKQPDDLKLMCDWVFQQYSHQGSVNGVGGHTDLNIFNGSEQEWEAWLAEHNPQVPADTVAADTVAVDTTTVAAQPSLCK